MLCHKGIEAHVHCTDRFPSFVRFDWVSEAFWAKERCFGAQNVLFCEGPSRLGAPSPGAPPVISCHTTWIWQGDHLGS